MTQTNYAVVMDDEYTPPAIINTNQDYINFVLNKAAESYQKQYNTADKESAITAAIESFNANLVPN